MSYLILEELQKWTRWATVATGHDNTSSRTLRHLLAKDIQELREWRKWAATLLKVHDLVQSGPESVTDDALRGQIWNAFLDLDDP